jgi:hypothetical protein
MRRDEKTQGWRCHVCGDGFEYEYGLESHWADRAVEHCATELALNFDLPYSAVLIDLWAGRKGVTVEEFKGMLARRAGENQTSAAKEPDPETRRVVRLAFGTKQPTRLRPAKQDSLFDPNRQARMMF